MEETTSQQAQGYPSPDITHTAVMDSDDIIGASLSRSFCANSDLFTHDLLGTPRDLPDEVYRKRAKFFRTGDFL